MHLFPGVTMPFTEGSMEVDESLRIRVWGQEPARPDDERDEYQRDKARVIHSAGFRRLQTKTQVMGVGEGDFHRTRLTHSIETAQIGEGLLERIRQNKPGKGLADWLPSRDLLAAACYAHDLGHPPFGHAGEIALHKCMRKHGGFEGNGQTIRVLTRLEKYLPGQGMNPTRRLLLAVLKYPAAYSEFIAQKYDEHPPKCFFDMEAQIIDRTLKEVCQQQEIEEFRSARSADDKPLHRTLDCSLMECADDIAYAVHDLEDIVGRRLVRRDDVLARTEGIFKAHGARIGAGQKAVSAKDFESAFSSSHNRKVFIGKLVNLFVTSVQISEIEHFTHPLFRYRVGFDPAIDALIKGLKKLTYELVIQRAEVQQLEHRGQRVVKALFNELMDAPKKLIPKEAWDALDLNDSDARRVCDYIAGMTDPYAEKIYNRLFTPGAGSSRDEL
jgi:dGTPase